MFQSTQNNLKKCLDNCLDVTTNSLFVVEFMLDLKAEEVTERTLFGYKSKNVFFTYLQTFLYVCCTGIFF